MIEFSDLVSALHVSVQQAGEALSRANLRTFEQYFVDRKKPDDAQAILQGALAEATTLSETGAPADALRRLASSLAAASTALEESSEALRPKVVAIDYPMVTKDGPTVHTVHVPLIALAPFAGVQLSKLTFKTDLDVQTSDEGKLQVAFVSSAPAERSATEGADRDVATRTSNTSIEIVIESVPTPDGLRKVIEGYERALRAQIPG
ncbi:MAG: DUF2589 domain-containing protein [Azospirillaceae bacterium]|nr:DUF2589 domain-containing protein [Azospirillaceae bacterium]